MKKIYFLLFFGAFFLGTYAQTTYWSTDGNSNVSNSSFLGTIDEFPLIFKTAGTETMRVLANGNLGIGTATPAEMLHITGNILSEGDLTVKDKITLTQNYEDCANWEIVRDKNGLNFVQNTSSQSNDSLSTRGFPSPCYSNNRLFINNTGFIGVGTTTPSARLDVKGNLKAALADIAGTLTASALSAKSANIGGALRAESADIDGTLTAEELNAQNATINRELNASNATITNLTANALEAQSANITGNFGVGCSNPPLTKMQIGNIWTFHDGPNDKIIGRNTYYNGSSNIRITSGIASRIYFNVDGDIVLQTAPTGAANSVIDGYWKTLCLKNDGNLGIGTSNPGAKLDVIGTIRAEEVKVCLNQGCDYVFEDDYELMNLNDLHSFIKTNKHLPDVAPAAEMEAEGINLSEMNALLLRKVEELTLYILQMEQRVSELESQKGGE